MERGDGAQLPVTAHLAELTEHEHEQALMRAYRQGVLDAARSGDGRPASAGGPLRLLLAGVGALLGVLLILALLLGLLTVMNAVTATGQTVTGLSEQAGSAAGRVGAAVGDVLYGLAERADPTLPPRAPLSLDPEFAALRTVAVDTVVGETGESVLMLEAVRRREGAASAETAQYAVVTHRLRAPRTTSILGVVVQSDTGEVTHYLDKGESFRIGRTLYKVNWLSAERGLVAIAEYRDPDRVAVRVEFAYD